MTFEELNIVRKLKKQLADENKKLCALKIVVGAFPHKYGKSDNSGSAGNFAKSAGYESFVLQIADTEKKIENVYNQLSESMSELSKKIEAEFTNTSEQTLLIYRYVACKPFHEIARLMHYSLRMVYKAHYRLLKKCSRVQSSAVEFT